MKNDYMNAGIKISIPPTVLFSVIGVINNVVATQTSDFKKKGQAIYMFGATRRELGGSEAALELGLSGGMIPTVDAQTALPRYRAIHGSWASAPSPPATTARTAALPWPLQKCA